MNEQLPMFDREGAIIARDEGIAQVSENKGEWLERMRRFAYLHAFHNDTVTVDDIRRVHATPPGYHYNVWGAVFNDSRFEWAGTFTHSENVKGHRNMIRVWRLKT